MAVWLAMWPAGAAEAYPAETYPEEVAERPRYRDLRFEEDWSGLGSVGGLPARDRFDPAKFIPLSASGKSWIGFGGELRARVQAHRGFRLGGDARDGRSSDDVFGLFRARVYADLHLGDHFRAFVEAKSALISQRDLPGGRGPGNTDTIALQNGFASLRGRLLGARIVLRAGRQELRFGRERLVSPFDWNNVRRTFDAVSLVVERQGVRAHAFVSRPVRVEPYGRNDHESGRLFYGVDVSSRLGAARFQAYAYGHRRRQLPDIGDRGIARRYTLGGRLRGSLPGTPLDGEVELAGQFGSQAGEAVAAFMASGEIGWWLRELPMAPRLHLAGDWASGDDGRGGNAGTFDPLFPNGNRFFGTVDLVGRRNLAAVSAGVSLGLAPRLRLGLEVFHFWRSRQSDSWYDASGRLLRPASAGRSRALGAEIDVHLHYRFDEHIDMVLGYGHFFPGAFARQSGPSQAVDLLYAWLRFRI